MVREAALAVLIGVFGLASCTGERSVYDAGGRVPDIGAPRDVPSPPLASDAAGGADARPARDSATDSGLDIHTDLYIDTGMDMGMDIATIARLNVVSLNLRCLQDDWELRRPVIVEALVASDAEILGLQEVCRDSQSDADNLADLVADLEARTGATWTTRFVGTHRAWDRYDEGIAVASRLDVVASESVLLPTGAFPRRVMMARFATAAGEVVFATTHLDHQNESVRARQAAAVVTALDAFAHVDEPVILTGDMNEGPDGDAAAAYDAAGLVDLWAALRPGEPGYTFPSSAPDTRIDYVRLRPGPAAWTARSIERILGTPTAGTYGSDHLGLAARIAR